MAKKPKKSNKQQTNLQEFVVATFVKEIEEAKEYEALLKNDDIPVSIKQQNEPSGEGTKVFAIMVPEDHLDEAIVVIESQDDYNDFYDFALESEDDDAFESNFFDDDI